MGRSFFAQNEQVSSSFAYDDTRAAGVALQSGSYTLEDDLNALRSQVKRILYSTSSLGNWVDDIVVAGGLQRGVNALGMDLADIEAKRFLFRTTVLTDVLVPTGSNFVVLSATGSTAPIVVAAVNGGSTIGAVAASASIGTYSINQVSGSNALQPKNLVVIRDGYTGQVIQDTFSGHDIFGLLQTDAPDGGTFNDSTQRAQISFVMVTVSGSDTITSVPAASIGGRVINYAYPQRVNLDAIPEDAYLNGTFVDMFQSGSAAATLADITLDRAIDNQGTTAATQTNNTTWDIASGFYLQFTNGIPILKLTSNGGGNQVDVQAAQVSVSSSSPTGFTQGLQVATGSTEIQVGVVAGTVGSKGVLTASAADGFDVLLSGGLAVRFSDSWTPGSTYTGSLPVGLGTVEWNNFKSEFGNVSILNAFHQLTSSISGTVKTRRADAGVNANTNADVNVTNGSGLDASLLDYSGKNFITEVAVFYNGQLLRNGAGSTSGHDVYPGTNRVTGDLKFTFKIKSGSNVTMETF